MFSSALMLKRMEKKERKNEFVNERKIFVTRILMKKNHFFFI